MSPDLEAAGRDVVAAPTAAPSAVETLERRARRRRSRRAAAMGALVLALVVGVAAVTVAATRGDDDPRVAVTPPGDLECTPAGHDFGGKVARSVWTVSNDGVTVGAARVWEEDGTAKIATWIESGVDPAPALIDRARTCVVEPPVVPLADYPARGVFVQVPGDPAELVVNESGIVLGSRGDDEAIVEDAPSTPPGTIPDDIAGGAHLETRTWPSPDGRRYLQQWRDKCQRTSVRLQRSDGVNPQPFGGYPETDVFSVALGWLDNETAAVMFGTQSCTADRSSLTGVFRMTIDSVSRMYFPAVDGKLDARVFQRVIAPTTTFPGTTSVPSATTTVPTTTGTPKILVPNVVGLDDDAARAALTAAGLNASVLASVSADVDAGTVFMQSPNAGTEVDPASMVVVTVAIEATEMSIVDARALWSSRRIAQYSFEYQQECFCPPATVAKVRITVRDGRVVDVVAVDPNETEILDLSEYPTVEKLFDVIEENEARSSMHVVAKYGAGIGVPISIDLSCVDTQVTDCGVAYRVSNVEISG